MCSDQVNLFDSQTTGCALTSRHRPKAHHRRLAQCWKYRGMCPQTPRSDIQSPHLDTQAQMTTVHSTQLQLH